MRRYILLYYKVEKRFQKGKKVCLFIDFDLRGAEKKMKLLKKKKKKSKGPIKIFFEAPLFSFFSLLFFDY